MYIYLPHFKNLTRGLIHPFSKRISCEMYDKQSLPIIESFSLQELYFTIAIYSHFSFIVLLRLWILHDFFIKTTKFYEWRVKKLIENWIGHQHMVKYFRSSKEFRFYNQINSAPEAGHCANSAHSAEKGRLCSFSLSWSQQEFELLGIYCI